MPNPYEDYDTAGQEISSTYEGRHVTLGEALINHPTHADGFVDYGDPVVFGTAAPDGWGVGVSFVSAAAATDLVSIDTEGIWALSVVGSDDAGNSAVRIGDPLFINRTTCIISKIRNQATMIPFGYALDTVNAGATSVIAVKVHWDMHDLVVGMWATVTSGSYGWSFTGELDSGASEGVNGYVQGNLSGTCTGHTYGLGSWLNLQAAYAGGAGHIHTPFEGGIWKGDADATLRAVFAGQHQAILSGAPASLHAWRLNTTQTIDALIAAANPGSVGYAASVATTSTKIGDIPIADIVGPGVVWVRVYDAAG